MSFTYNKKLGGGVNRLIFVNKNTGPIYNRYVPGSGVGSRNRSVRRHLLRKATTNSACCSNIPIFSSRFTQRNSSFGELSQTQTQPQPRSLSNSSVEKYTNPNPRLFNLNVTQRRRPFSFGQSQPRSFNMNVTRRRPVLSSYSSQPQPQPQQTTTSKPFQRNFYTYKRPFNMALTRRKRSPLTLPYLFYISDTNNSTNINNNTNNDESQNQFQTQSPQSQTE